MLNLGTIFGLLICLVLVVLFWWSTFHHAQRHRRMHRDLDQWHRNQSGNVTDMEGEETNGEL